MSLSNAAQLPDGFRDASSVPIVIPLAEADGNALPHPSVREYRGGGRNFAPVFHSKWLNTWDTEGAY